MDAIIITENTCEFYRILKRGDQTCDAGLWPSVTLSEAICAGLEAIYGFCALSQGSFAMLRPHVVSQLFAGHMLRKATSSLHFSTLIHKWQRRRDRLTALMKRIEFPKLDRFEVDGKIFQLPLRAVSAPKDQPTQEELEYLVGFFDGDGCVTMRTSGSVYLEVGQSVSSVNVLLHYRNVFGGGIYAGCKQTGLRQATLTWRIGGAAMKRAASLMACVTSMKQAQLEIAAADSKVSEDKRLTVGEDLRALKSKGHVPVDMSISWLFVAGFFDAEGWIGVDSGHVRVLLTLAQVNAHVLECILSFFKRNNLERWCLYPKSSSFVLACSHTQTSKRTLEHMLAHGLSVKRQSAELALSLNVQNHLETRQAISELGGRQSRYARLDQEGVFRAQQIRNLQKRFHYASCEKTRANLGQDIQRLREEHALQKMISQCRLLRSDIRRRLSDGGILARCAGDPIS